MRPFDLQALKKPTNLTINSDLLAKAKAENINLSATLEAALANKLVMIGREKWLNENAGAISVYNEFVEENGLFSDDIRSF
jgi:antitoxin CcdA